MKRILMGLLSGIAAGAGLGLLLGKGGGSGGGTGDLRNQIVALLQQAQDAFEQGRTRAITAARQQATLTGDAAEAGASQSQAVTERATAAVAEPVRGFTDQLKVRWREAVAEGRLASEAKQAELRRKYLEDTKRI
ncbi:MAG: hypothetical protein HYX51_07940 [Chloroflexi bacterium]|nr:hypothetical protein [Chloroflexota bacterium]